MRLHVPALPWFDTVRANSQCAYTNKVIRFADMMTSLGHEVFVYGGETTDTKDAELVTVIMTEERGENVISWATDDHLWSLFNQRCGAEILRRKQDNDILCIIGGTCQQPVASWVPDLPVVEWGIGYEGTFAPFRVFESYAWMHSVVAAQAGSASAADGRYYDAVIPNSFSLEEFPFTPKSDGYVLYIGRLIERKGLAVVRDIAERIDRQLVVAGAGDESLIPPGAEYAGLVGPEERAMIMGGAAVTLVPTQYVEPFGGVAVESMMCGTPVLSNDWGAFTETVKPGVSGYRCRTLADFVTSVELAAALPREKVREWSLQYDVNVVRHLYERYLNDVRQVQWGKGWHS